MFGLGAGELLIILVFALLFVGPKKLPELAKGLGKALRSFNDAKNDLVNTIDIESQIAESKPDVDKVQDDSHGEPENKLDKEEVATNISKES